MPGFERGRNAALLGDFVFDEEIDRPLSMVRAHIVVLEFEEDGHEFVELTRGRCVLNAMD